MSAFPDDRQACNTLTHACRVPSSSFYFLDYDSSAAAQAGAPGLISLGTCAFQRTSAPYNLEWVTLWEPQLQGYDLSAESCLNAERWSFFLPPLSGDLHACSIRWDWSRALEDNNSLILIYKSNCFDKAIAEISVVMTECDTWSTLVHVILGP